jgi:hypothetical protein
MQDAIAITVAVAAGLWLARTLWQQMLSPSCGKADSPPGSDGFVSLGDLSASAKKPGRPEERPGS